MSLVTARVVVAVEAYRFVLLSVLFSFLHHAVNLILTETPFVILDGDLLLLACMSITYFLPNFRYDDYATLQITRL